MRDTKESLKEEITTLRDDNKHLFVIGFALITGAMTMLLQVVNGNLKLFNIFAALIGLLGLFPIISKFTNNREALDKLIQKLKE